MTENQSRVFVHLNITLSFINSFGTKFQTTVVVCFFILTNYRLERCLYVKLKDWMSNSVDPDETAHWAVCKSLLLSPAAVKEFIYKLVTMLQIRFFFVFFFPTEKSWIFYFSIKTYIVGWGASNEYPKCMFSFLFFLFALRFYGPVNPMGSCRARSVYLTTRLLGRLSPLSG